MLERIKDYLMTLHGIILYLFYYRRTCYWGYEKIRKMQYTHIKKVLRVCERKIPYYKELFSEIDFNVARDFKSLEDLKRIPVTTKETVKERKDDFINPDYVKRAIELKTSGSTGRPLSILVTRHQWAVEQAMVWRHWAWNGYHFRDRMAIVRSYTPKNGQLIKWDHMRNFIYYSPFHLTEENMKMYLEHMVCNKIRYIRGYPSSVKPLADFVLKTKQQVPHLKGIFTASEVLSDADRATIEAAFGCKVINWYGQAEGTITMGECNQHHGMHVFEEYGYLELLDTEDPEHKEMIATTLNNYAMPLLRYRTGDIAQYSGKTCSCGRTLTIIDNVIGRSSDVLQFRDRKVPLTNFYTAMEHFQTVESWQIVQYVGRDRVELIIHGEVNEADMDVLRKEFAVRLPQEIEFVVRPGGEFVQSAEGKKNAFAIIK